MINDSIKAKLNKLIAVYGETINEETIKINIVLSFLDNLGYDKDLFLFECKQVCDGRVDISVYDENLRKTILYVEVKKSNYEIKGKDLGQLANYLNSANIDWGIFTNGTKYILVNNKVEGQSHEKDVLTFELIDNKLAYTARKRNANNLKFFSYDYLIIKKLTDYFIYLASYRNTINNLHSYRQYESTIYNYLNHLCDRFSSFDLSYINTDTLSKYIMDTIANSTGFNNKKMKNQQTIINKYAYINGFYTKSIEKIEKRNPFKKMSSIEFLANISKHFELKDKEINNNHELLTNEEIKMLINFEGKKESMSSRNKIIVLLFVYCGLDRHEILELKQQDINLKQKLLSVDGRKIPLPNLLCELLDNYIEVIKKDKSKLDYLFYIKRNNEYTKLKDTHVNFIVNNYIDSIDISESRKKIITSTFIKRSLIKNMFQAGIHLEEICKFTGLSLTTVSEYISENEIAESVSLSNIRKKHPYKDMFI